MVDIGVVDVAVHVNIIEHLRIALVFTEPSDLNVTATTTTTQEEGVDGRVCSCAFFHTTTRTFPTTYHACNVQKKRESGILNVSTMTTRLYQIITGGGYYSLLRVFTV